MTHHNAPRTATRLGALATAALLPVVVVGPALAGDGDVIRRGSCTGATDWKLKASPEDGRIEVEGEIDSNYNGQTWRWRIRHNGSLSARGTATTQPPSGSFEVRRVLVDAPGIDTIVFRARNPQTDEVCRGVLRY